MSQTPERLSDAADTLLQVIKRFNEENLLSKALRDQYSSTPEYSRTDEEIRAQKCEAPLVSQNSNLYNLHRAIVIVLTDHQNALRKIWQNPHGFSEALEIRKIVELQLAQIEHLVNLPPERFFPEFFSPSPSYIDPVSILLLASLVELFFQHLEASQELIEDPYDSRLSKSKLLR